MINKDKAFGAVAVYKREDGTFLFLLVKQAGGYWSFPKGHVEGEETPLETAKRELKEETGLTGLDWRENDLFTVEYEFDRGGQKYLKTSSFFLGLTDVKVEPKPQEEFKKEILNADWFSYEEAKKILDNYAPAINILDQVHQFLKTK